MTTFPTSKFLITLFSLSLLAGCATPPDKPASLTGKKAQESGDVRDRAESMRQRELTVIHWLGVADTARNGGDLDTSESAYRNILAIDPANLRANQGLQQLAAERRHRTLIVTASNQQQHGESEAALATLRPVLAENPKQREALALKRQIEEQRQRDSYRPALNASARKPITLEFRDANLRSIFEMVSRLSSINFIFDREVRPDLKASIFIKDGTIEDAVKMLLLTNGLEQRILNGNTVLIYPNTPARSRDYQELVVRSFYLGNADVKQTLNMLKTILKTKDVYLDERLNLLVIRDTPESVALAEKLITAQDLAEQEVMLEMEVLEVSTGRLSELGIGYPTKIGFGIGGISDKGGVLSLDELRNINSGMIKVTMPDPAILLKLSKTDNDSNLLANPRIRVKNREKAKIHIGERVPVITTTSTANVGISESVNYLEVGLKLNVEPNIHLDDDVAIKVGLEVSNIIDTITTNTGSKSYRLGTRTAETTLRLKDGETQVLAGLIQDIDRKSAQKVPLLGDIPVLGRLFSSDGSDKTKSEIMLLITPHIVRNLERPAAGVTEFMSGTEGRIGTTLTAMAPAANMQTVTDDTHADRANDDESPSSEAAVESGTQEPVPQFSAQPYKAPLLHPLPANDQQ